MPNENSNKPSSGRSSPRLQDQHVLSDPQLKQLILQIKLQNDEIINNQKTFMKQLDINTAEIEQLKSENTELKSSIDLMQEKFVRLDQHSRKDVVIMTGLEYNQQTGETQSNLEGRVLDIINSVTNQNFTIRDFIAIHRNGRSNKGNGRPPSVTIKFLRYYDKDLLFNKRANTSRKNSFPSVNFHHCLCEGMIDIQNALKSERSVKFVRYMGASRHFSVCVKREGGDDVFLNRIESVAQFKAELAKLE